MGNAKTAELALLILLAGGTACQGEQITIEEAEGKCAPADIRALALELKSEDWQATTNALHRLRRIIDSHAGDDTETFCPVLAPLMSMVGWGGEARRNADLAAALIVKIGEPAVPKLLEALAWPEARLRWSAMKILTSMGPGKAPVPGAIIPLLSDKDAYVRRVAIECLGKLGENAKDAVSHLQKATRDAVPENRIYSHMALIPITGTAGPHVAAITSYLRHDDPSTRGLAASMLRECGVLARDSWPDLLLSLKDPHEQVRVYAAASLGAIGADSQEVVAALVEVLMQGGEAARSAAASLGRIGPEARDAVPALEDALKRGPGWWVAAKALGKIGGAEVVPILTRALKSGNGDIRLESARQLGELGALSASALPSLRECLRDEKAYVRKAATTAVKDIKDAIEKRR